MTNNLKDALLGERTKHEAAIRAINATLAVLGYKAYEPVPDEKPVAKKKAAPSHKPRAKYHRLPDGLVSDAVLAEMRVLDGAESLADIVSAAGKRLLLTDHKRVPRRKIQKTVWNLVRAGKLVRHDNTDPTSYSLA